MVNIRMSPKPESRLWKSLRDGVTGIHWVRIESWASPGVPDVNGCGDFGEFWIELKVTKSNRVVLSPHQISWHLTRARHSGRSYILAREASRDPLFLFSGNQAKDLADKKISQISPMVKITYSYDWTKLMDTIAKDCRSNRSE